MRLILLLGLFLFMQGNLAAQRLDFGQLKTISAQFPEIPAGLFEATAFQASRWERIPHDEKVPCNGKPLACGFTGLITDGKGILRENALRISELSGIPAEILLREPEMEIKAWHLAMRKLAEEYVPTMPEDWLWLSGLLSEIPAEDAFIYPLTLWLDETAFWWRKIAGVSVNVQQLVPEEYWYLIRSPLHELRIDHPGVSVQMAPSCNRGSRNGTSVSAITVHTAQGSYAGTIAWFMNCNSNVSAHYVIRASDGHITQMVAEADRAFHVGSENSYTVGIEHEGFVSNPAWITDTMLVSSAALVRGICERNQIQTHRTAWWPWTAGVLYNQAGIPGSCSRIKGHQHYPNQTHTDPGTYFPWEKYYRLINPAPQAEILTGNSGNLSFPGNGTSYIGDLRKIWRIGNGQSPLMVQFSQFETEASWDYVMLYDGPDIHSPMILQHSGSTVPNPVTAVSGYLTIEFRSDCAINGHGFSLSWEHQQSQSGDSLPPLSVILSPGQEWITQSFHAYFQDIEPGNISGPEYCFLLAASHDGSQYRANSNQSMFFETFSQGPLPHIDWTILEGQWLVSGYSLYQPQPQTTQARAAFKFRPDLQEPMLLRTMLRFQTNQADAGVGIYLFGDSLLEVNHGQSLLLWFAASGQIEFYACSLSTQQLLSQNSVNLNGSWIALDVLIHPSDSRAQIWINNQKMVEINNLPALWPARWISWITRRSSLELKSLRIFRSRPCNQPVWVPVAQGLLGWLNNPNPDPVTPGGYMLALSMDSAGNFSPEDQVYIRMDFTPPTQATWLADGNISDLDSLYGSQWWAYWSGIHDPHSGIAAVELALGTVPGSDDLMPFTPVSGQSPQAWPLPSGLPTGVRIYATIRGQNGAGMLGPEQSSDGMILVSTGIENLDHEPADRWIVFPNPAVDILQISGYKGVCPQLISIDGRQVLPESCFYTSNGILLRLPAGIAPGAYILWSTEGLKIPLIIGQP